MAFPESCRSARPSYSSRSSSVSVKVIVPGTARRRVIAGNWRADASLDDDELDTRGYRPKSGWNPAA